MNLAVSLNPTRAAKTARVSPLAPSGFPNLPPVAGVRLACDNCGIRYSGRPDLLWAEFTPAATVAGVFTKSLTMGAPVIWCKDILNKGKARGVLVNAGNSNAFTGKAGWDAMMRTIKAAAKTVGCAEDEIYVSSTGVIGEPLPDHKVTACLPRLHAQLGAENWQDAACAIMTTDTFAKAATQSCVIDGKKITINGIAKGSGMIAPDMATLLAFVFTDAAIAQPVLQKCLSEINEKTFNCITVDSDTSTSDMALVFATGGAGHAPILDSKDSRLNPFKKALHKVFLDMAHQVIQDGEGAEKFITINVSGAAGKRAAKKIALSIANSPLVKTAIAGEDANWGRIAAAVGKAGEKADRDKLTIAIGGVTIAYMGERVKDYDETPVVRHIKGRDIVIDVDVGVGKSKATVWTCDLTHGYIDINGSYRS